jgi:hypothetical protein
MAAPLASSKCRWGNTFSGAFHSYAQDVASTMDGFTLPLASVLLVSRSTPLLQIEQFISDLPELAI